MIFDFDGVIVDSEPAHARSMAIMLRQIGLRVPADMESNWTRFIGRGDRECIIDLAREQGVELSDNQLLDAVRLKAEAFQTSQVQELITPFAATISLLRAASTSMPVAVCSGSVRDTVLRGLERLGVMDCLRTVVTADDVTRNKPAPDPYLLAAERLQINPAQGAAIEDSPTGITSARAAGLYVYGVAHSFPRERLSHAHEVHDSTASITVR